MSSPSSSEARILARAVELATEPERLAYLREACGDDVKLRQSVAELLEAHFAAENFIEPHLANDRQRGGAGLIEGPGSTIGRYKLLEQIGEGGFAVVYMAEQLEPVRRKVALKIIKLGMNTKQVVARFEAERQALAMMDHPNIAKVHDAGATETGRPFFVMELVRGVPITEYCENNRLSINERLGLLMPVCHAIQHAHQKGVIHRDIKPSNILITLDDSEPHPMVIDFGVAKAIDQRLTEKTVHTGFAQMIGTPAYMSPEQAEMSKQDVDTRTDVYSLGILLYELLTGTTPFPEKRLQTASYAEIQRIIHEEEPVRPSTVVTRPDGRLRTIAMNRRSEAGALVRLIKGDLDWIVLKAIDKDRNRRYGTPDEMAADIRRHIMHEPVIARPPSNLYRLSRFIRRNRIVATAGLVVCVALLAGVSLALVGLGQAMQEARRARRALYLTEIKLAAQALEARNSGDGLRRLARQIPTKEAAQDFRGWEWSYLWNQVRSDAAFELGRHANAIRSVAFSPKGRLAASSDIAGNVCVWDVSARRRLYHFEQPDIVHQALFYSEDILLTADGLGALSVYDLEQVRLIQAVDLEASVRAIALSPRRDRLAALTWSADSPASIISWTLAPSGSQPVVPALSQALRFRIEERKVGRRWLRLTGALTYSLSGSELAVGLGDGSIQIYSAVTGALRKTLQATVDSVAAGITTLAYSPDGRWLASNGNRGDEVHEVIVWDTDTWAEIAVLPGHVRGARQLVFSPAGDSLFVVSGDQTLRHWGTAQWSIDRTFLGHYSPLNALALSPSGHLALTGGNDTRLLAWDMSRPSERLEPIVIAGLRGFEFSPSGGLLATIEDLEDHPQERRVSLRFRPGFASRKELPSLGNQVVDLAFSLDGQILAALSPDTVRLWNLRDQRLESGGDLPHSDSRLIAGFSADGTRLLLVDRDFTVLLWSVSTGAPESVWSARAEDPLPDYFDKASLAFHVQSSTLVLGGTGQASVWDVEGRTRRGVLAGHGISRVEPTISLGGTFIATLGEEAADRPIRLWNLATLEPVRAIETPPQPIFGLAFSPDGERVAIGLYRFGQMGLFDVETGIQLLTIPQSFGITRRLKWSPDGRALIAQADGAIGIIWRTAPLAELHAGP